MRRVRGSVGRRRKRPGSVRLVVFLAILVALLVRATGVSGGAASAAPRAHPVGGLPRFTVVAPSDGGQGAASSTLPTWQSSFVLGGTTYDDTMIGTNPAAGSAKTVVPVELIPISFSFAAGGTIDATSLTSDVKASPLFASAKFTSGNTQLVDAMRRAEFWSTVSTVAPNYHLLLGKPVVEPTLSISVPANEGSYVGAKGNGLRNINSKSKTPYGYVSYEWFVPELESLLGADGFNVATLPMAFSGDIFLYQNGNQGDCCVYGFHGATSTSGGQLTFAYGNYLSAGLVGKGKTALQDIYSLSHESVEWSDDPFVNDVVPQWVQPGSGVCFSDLLEGADVVEALPHPSFTIKTKKPTQTWHPTDVAGISWFAHSSPSQEINGLYSYAGLLSAPSTLC